MVASRYLRPAKGHPMGPFVIPLALFLAPLAWLLIELMRDLDPVPRKAGITWVVSMLFAVLLMGAGVRPLAMLFGAVSVLALGSLAVWFTTADEPGEPEGERRAPVQPEPEPDTGPDDDVVFDPELQIDWDAFDRARAEWEKELARERETKRVPELV
jgi:hypothetical protein